MDTRMSWIRLGVLLVIMGGIILTVWNLGTKIDLSDMPGTFLNPLFIIGIISLLAGIVVLRMKF